MSEWEKALEEASKHFQKVKKKAKEISEQILREAEAEASKEKKA